MSQLKWWMKWAFWTPLFMLINYAIGIWFLIRHPISFVKFVEEFRRFEQRIDDNEHITSSGYYEQPRRIRRAWNKKLKKRMRDV